MFDSYSPFLSTGSLNLCPTLLRLNTRHMMVDRSKVEKSKLLEWLLHNWQASMKVAYPVDGHMSAINILHTLEISNSISSFLGLPQLNVDIENFSDLAGDSYKEYTTADAWNHLLQIIAVQESKVNTHSVTKFREEVYDEEFATAVLNVLNKRLKDSTLLLSTNRHDIGVNQDYSSILHLIVLSTLVIGNLGTVCENSHDDTNYRGYLDLCMLTEDLSKLFSNWSTTLIKYESNAFSLYVTGIILCSTKKAFITTKAQSILRSSSRSTYDCLLSYLPPKDDLPLHSIIAAKTSRDVNLTSVAFGLYLVSNGSLVSTSTFASIDQLLANITLSESKELGDSIEVFLSCSDFLYTFLEEFSGSLSSSHYVILLRYLGSNLLANRIWKLSEITLKTTIRYLSMGCRYCLNLSKTNIHDSAVSDWQDIFKFVIKAVFDSPVQSKLIRVHLFELLCLVIETLVDNEEVLLLSQEYLQGVLNEATDVFYYSISPSLSSMMSEIAYKQRMGLYSIIIQGVGPLLVDTSNICFLAHLLSKLAGTDGDIMILSICELLKIVIIQGQSSNHIFIKHSLDYIASVYQVSGAAELLDSACDPIFDFWLKQTTDSLEGDIFPLRIFPYHVFGYKSEKHFMESNVTQLIARALIFNNYIATKSYLKHFTHTTEIPLNNAYSESLYKAISLGYKSLDISIEDLYSIIDQRVKTDQPVRTLINEQMLYILRELLSSTDVSDCKIEFPSSSTLAPLNGNLQELMPSISRLGVSPQKVIEYIQLTTDGDISKLIGKTGAIPTTILRGIFKSHEKLTSENEKYLGLRRCLFFLTILLSENVPKSKAAKRRSSTTVEDGNIKGYTLELCLRGAISLISLPRVEEEACRLLQLLISSAPRYLLIELGFSVVQGCLSELEIKGVSNCKRGLLAEIDSCLVESQKFWEAKILSKSINYLLNKDAALFSDSDVVNIISGDNSQFYFPQVRKCCWDILALQLECESFSRGLLAKMDPEIRSDTATKLLSNMRSYYPDTEGFTTWAGRFIATSFLEDDSLSVGLNETKSEDLNSLADDDLRSWFMDDPIFCNVIRIIRKILQTGNFRQIEYVEICLGWIQQYITINRQSLLDCLPGILLDGTNSEMAQSYVVRSRNMLLTIKDPNKTFASWVKNVTLSMLTAIAKDHPIFQGLEILVQNIEELSSSLFPVLVHQIMSEKRFKQSGDMLNAVFAYYLSNANEGVNQDHRVLELLIDTVLYLRRFNLVGLESSSSPLKVSWEGCAIWAFKLGRYQTALMFLEIHWNTTQSYSLELFSKISKLIKYPDMYSSIAPDPSLQGAIDISLKNSTSNKESLNAMIFESALNNAISSGYDWDLNNHSSITLARSFNNTGIYSIADLIYQAELGKGQTKEYSSTWKLEKWTLPDIADPKNKDELIYQLFKGMQDTFCEISSFGKIYNKALKCMVVEDHPFYSDLFQVLAITTEAQDIFETKNITDTLTAQRKSSSNWVNYDSFDKIEDILVARQISWRILHRRLSQNEDTATRTVGDVTLAFACSFVDHCQLAVRNKSFLKAMNSIVKFLHSKLPQYNEIIKMASTIESAAVCWATGNQTTSIDMLNSVISLDSFLHVPKEAGYFFSRSNVHAKLASWLSLARHETDNVIVTEYLDPACRYRNEDINCNPLEDKTEFYHMFASFCDEKFRSEALNREMSIQYRQRKDKDRRLNELSKQKILSKESKLLKNRLEKLRVNHDNQYQILKATSQNFLFKSIKNYLYSICEGDEHRGDVSRFLDLWFANATNPIYIVHLNSMVAKFGSRIPSIKLVPWISQLSSKLSLEVNEFQKTLWNIVGKVCEDHPYHTMYHILALKLFPKHEARHMVGVKFFDVLKKRKKIDNELLTNFESLAIMTAAVAKISPKQSNGQTASKMQFDRMGEPGVWWLKTLPTLELPMPTAEIELRSDRKYTVANLPTVTKILKQVTIASGINHPKIVSVVDSRGQTNLALIKGGERDDLRQDAVMEQVFDQVNLFMKSDRQAKTRNMRVRIYKLVPLGPGGGMIEFVRNTSPFIGVTQELHKKYNPNDIDADEARREMQAVEAESKEVRVEVYKSIEKRLKPAFRYFFTERFYSPEEWFHNRALYSKSTAVNSMIGYILGLGDRHCSNILVDTLTGEIIHIDLGIAFDQGKLLPIPETVPFRLTRDIVDGMGISGVKGVFQKCCEIALAVLRDEAEAISTILNVLRYDPLYTW
ncbi:DNA-binding protein kinase TEL1 [Sugiyamaella lignohabitans]|uniref:Serine/threonine-protein kinase TEL1 n=1 Tax=Sugiyamaella lignohabitans TaxID=796027 RepID=A0A167E140_9ASCO|nr:DNA-binding protein kinase TEL1 [Sugiyamaella lignohabitans]ANB13526.1 DNA-binding protein kinase TEL1 [Sugiyamaella lignohabitans]